MLGTKKPIFIVGCTNSGTKCLFFSLMEHEDLGGLKRELHFFGIQPNIDGRLNRLFALYPCFYSNFAHINYVPKSFSTGPMDKTHVEETISNAKKMFPDEYVEGNRLLFKDPKLSLRITWIKKLWPDAHIIAIVRNPWAVSEGIKRKISIMGDVPANMDIVTTAAQWNAVNSIILNDSKGIDNFQLIRYEDMIAAERYPGKLDQNCFWSRLLGHLKLKAKSFCIPNRSEFSYFKKDTNLNSINSLTKWEQDYITTSCKSLIDKFGYTDMLKNNS